MVTGYVTYYNDWDALVDGSNTASFCSFSDWRVPTINELENIANRGRSSPAIDTTYFPNTNASDFWSASPNTHPQNWAWSVNFDYGLSYSGTRDDYKHVRLVRSGQ